jgi:hypothetical protein
MEIPQKLKTVLPYDTAIPLLGGYPEEMNPLFQKYTCSSMFIVALFTIAKIWNQARYPSVNLQLINR